MAFKFKNMSQYIRNAIEPILSASHLVQTAHVNSVDKRLSERMSQELGEFKSELDATLAQYKNLIETSLQEQTKKIDSFTTIAVGTIVIWPSATNPKDMPYYLECNGQAVNRSLYPDLYNIVGAYVPNLNNRFLQGRGNKTVGTLVDAGLPNITGQVGTFSVKNRDDNVKTGAFANSSLNRGGYIDAYSQRESGLIDFNASKSNAIYGKSTTVQPPAFVCRFLIRAKP